MNSVAASAIGARLLASSVKFQRVDRLRTSGTVGPDTYQPNQWQVEQIFCCFVLASINLFSGGLLVKNVSIATLILVGLGNQVWDQTSYRTINCFDGIFIKTVGMNTVTFNTKLKTQHHDGFSRDAIFFLKDLRLLI